MQILFAAIFSLARMVGGPYLTYVTLTADYPLLIKVHKDVWSSWTEPITATTSGLLIQFLC